MTVKSDQRKIIYEGNGTTTQFAVPFYFINQSDIEVSVYDGTTTTPLVLNTDFTLTGAGVETGGTLTTVSPVASGSEIAILRNVPYKQEMDIPENGIFPSQNMERALDRLTMQTQQLAEQVARSVTVDVFSDADPSELIGKIEDLWDIKDDMTTVAGISSAVSDVSANKSNINAAVANESNINAAVSNETNINAAVANESNINAAVANATNINAAVANESNINAAVANETNINAAVANETNINAAVANETNINTAVSNMAAIIDAPNQASAAAASATLAQDWASKMDGQVASTDYSSKYYAGQSALSAQQAAISAAGTHFKLFQHQWFDYEVNDTAWLRADTFSWQDGTVYSNAYNHLVTDIDGVTASTETVGGYTVTFYRASDGHKIVLADQETTVLNIYNSTGVAWYYVLDTANNRFKLPRTKYGFDGLRGNVGDYISESLPNITGRSGDRTLNGASGAFYTENGTIGNYGSTTTANSVVKFDASRSSSTYQNGASVQQRGTQMFLYFYVGQYTQSAIEQTAGLNAELFNGKADRDLSNLSATGNDKFVTKETAQTISGVKTFSSVPVMTETLTATDNSTKIPTTAWVQSNIGVVNYAAGSNISATIRASSGTGYKPTKKGILVIKENNASGGINTLYIYNSDGTQVASFKINSEASASGSSSTVIVPVSPNFSYRTWGGNGLEMECLFFPYYSG